MEVVTGNITIKHILQHNNNWRRFYNKHKHRIRPSVVENINKLFICRTQELGFHRYQCPNCGDIITVAHSCKSRFCSSCGKLATDRWMLHSLSFFPNVSYQHLVLTIPEELRDLILLNRRFMLNALFRLAASCISSWCSFQKSYIPGITMILHTFGRDLKFNPSPLAGCLKLLTLFYLIRFTVARRKIFERGNDTIDRYPLPYRGRLTKLLCISKEVFKKLKAALAEFGFKPKAAHPRPKTSFQQKHSKKESLIGSRNDNHKPDRDRCISSFEPSDLFTNKSSSFWRERNLKDWFKEQASYEDSRYLEYYPLNL